VEALGLPCVFALIMMLLWATFSHDGYLYCYAGLWLVCFCHRRIQSLVLARRERIHSLSDGNPLLGNKLIIEPVVIGLIGYGVLWLYEQEGYDPQGLPYFLLLGCFTVPFVEWTRQAMWRRRLQGMSNARIESENAVSDYQRMWGN
jgi:hypothetical protein